ncbi:MAG: hypothetical protein ACO1NS_00030 [Daejeonella sp.]|uniref:hypothetical protein n=1 Tax=Daejeonella sp. JGW-45 TaxID=3034148 RepID=UPI0023EBFC30|nr:hypothetical protein [Daejeonella sp. JGW-45]
MKNLLMIGLVAGSIVTALSSCSATQEGSSVTDSASVDSMAVDTMMSDTTLVDSVVTDTSKRDSM